MAEGALLGIGTEETAEAEPLEPVLRDRLLKNLAPRGDSSAETVGSFRAAPRDRDRLTHNDPITAISGAHDEERKDRHLRDLRQREGPTRNANAFAEHPAFRGRDSFDDAVTLNRNDFPLPERAQEIERQERAIRAIGDLD